MKIPSRALLQNLRLPMAIVITLSFTPLASATQQCQVHKAQHATTVETLEREQLSNQSDNGSSFTSLEQQMVAAAEVRECVEQMDSSGAPNTEST